MKIPIQIDVRGPGLVIANEVYLIKAILEEKGYEVELDDPQPPTAKEFDPYDIDGGNVKIKLIAHHSPWPG